ncbi:MAG: phage holin family protein [Clostridia bacterium]
MKRLAIRIFIYFLALWGMSLVLPQIFGEPAFIALAALVLALVNTIIRPLLNLLALPLSIVTLGIAGIFVNMLTLLITDSIVRQIGIEGFWAYFLAALVIMICDSLVRNSKADRCMRA